MIGKEEAGHKAEAKLEAAHKAEVKAEQHEKEALDKQRASPSGMHNRLNAIEAALMARSHLPILNELPEHRSLDEIEADEKKAEEAAAKEAKSHK